jgi:hypothetical protein
MAPRSCQPGHEVPRDKAKVEVAVLVVERWILARLRNRRFFSLAELNQAIAELVTDLNARSMCRVGISPRDLFRELDQPAFIAALAGAYERAPKTAVDVSDWIVWLLKQFDPAADDFDIFLRPDTLTRVFGRAYPKLLTPQAKRRIGLEGVLLTLAPWLDPRCTWPVARRSRAADRSPPGSNIPASPSVPTMMRHLPPGSLALRA